MDGGVVGNGGVFVISLGVAEVVFVFGIECPIAVETHYGPSGE